MMLSIQGGNQKPATKPREPDWDGWAAWLQQYRGMTSRAAWQWLSDEQDRLVDERGIDLTEAGAILDRELKRQRKAVAA